jgi:flagellar biosynthetic protein FliQ
MEILMEHLGKGLWISLMLSMPAVLLAAGIGLIVGILQAVTQVQEQTIAAAPKIMGVFLLIILGGGLMMTMLTDYVRESAYLAFNEIPNSEVMVLPPKPKTAKQEQAMSFFNSRLKRGNTGKTQAFFDQPAPDTGSGQSSTAIINRSRSFRPEPDVAEQMSLQQRRGR